jgi:dTDP-4-dehydrorhamnose reductase
MKLLITGASGFLGWHICQQIPPQFEVHGIYYRQNYPQEQVEWHRCNLLEETDLAELFHKIKPDIVLHAAAIANANFCEEHPALSYHVNVYSTIALAELCEAAKIPLLFISSDLVFNGNNAPYGEEDFPFPISRYGEQKLAAEEALLDDFEQTMICRLPLLFGLGPDYSSCFFKDWLDALQKGEPISAFTDEYRTPISAYTAAEGIWKAITFLLKPPLEKENRLLHLGGSERISRYELACLIAAVFEIDQPNIEAVLRKDAALLAPRPEDVSLDSSLAAKLLNFEAKSIKEQLSFLKTS